MHDVDWLSANQTQSQNLVVNGKESYEYIWHHTCNGEGENEKYGTIGAREL